jgi:hypothetical protein
VDRIGDDNIADVTRFLYAALVSEGGGFGSALGAPGEEEVAIRLNESITATFEDLGILLKGDRTMLTPKYPIVRDAPVAGKSTDHLISFVQRAAYTVAMEPIDLGLGASYNKKGTRYRAGWAAKAFEDIKEKDPTCKTVAIISATPAEMRAPIAKYALAMLGEENTVNWLSDSDRRAFLSERTELATAEK